MEVDQDMLNLVAKEAAPYAKIIFESYVLPVALQHLRKGKNRRAKESQIRQKVQDYLGGTYAQCAYVKTLAFKNVAKRLLDIYVPLTLIHEEDQSEIEIATDCSILEDNHSVLVVDAAGMGKSTVARRLVLDYIANKDRIPVMFELRSFFLRALTWRNCFLIRSVSGISVKKTYLRQCRCC